MGLLIRHLSLTGRFEKEQARKTLAGLSGIPNSQTTNFRRRADLDLEGRLLVRLGSLGRPGYLRVRLVPESPGTLAARPPGRPDFRRR